jgi:hypothetical protein
MDKVQKHNSFKTLCVLSNLQIVNRCLKLFSDIVIR